MTPYFQQDGVTLYLGDCRELDIVADAVITDPPYGQTSLPWDRWVTGWVDALRANSLWCFGTLRMFMAHSADFAKWKLSQDVIWEKHNGSSFHADRFKRVHEQPAHFYRGPWADVFKSPVKTHDATKRTVRRKSRPPHMGHIEAGSYTSIDGGPRLMRSVLRVRSMHGSAQHPTEKPQGILLPLLEYSVPSGGLVYDPFCGSGSLIVAARARGLRAVGCEVNERYLERAASRLSKGVVA